MSILEAMDLQMAIIAHLNWKSKLSDFFYGIEDLSIADVPEHTTCDFGKWLYSSGLQEFAEFPAIKTVETLHQKVHQRIKNLIIMPKAKRMSDEGKQALTEFKQECDRLVTLLESMEEHAKK
ncbi:MAG: hypothetical protein D3923_06765 [Candidatus Electrothrix sp. AR3]|nr:hypothetical protein [Candidatus Electrothrix sp. AR3]